MALEEIESLRGDLKHNLKALEGAPLPVEVKKYLKATLWPFLESLVDGVSALDAVQDEQGDAIDELIEESGELLHGETATDLIEVLTMGGELVAELKKRILPGDPLLARIEDFGLRAAKAMEKIAEISVDDVEETEGGEEEEGDEEEVADGDH